MSVTTHKCVNDAVGHREVIQGLENVRKKQTNRQNGTLTRILSMKTPVLFIFHAIWN